MISDALEHRRTQQMKILRLGVLLAAVIAGGALALWLASGKQAPERLAAAEIVTIGRYIEARDRRHGPRAETGEPDLLRVESPAFARAKA